MAIKLPSFKFFTAADAKTRVFLLFSAIAALSLVTYVVVRYFSGGPAGGTAQVATAPSSLQSVPGSTQLTSEYYKALMQANAQASKQAQMTGGSAVPTLVNMPGQGETNCTILCPGEENANVADDINNLVKQGKLSQEDANRLLDLAKKNVTPDEYAAALNELVRQGKLTPEQARALLDKYKKQYARGLANESGAAMDAMIKSGELPLDVANQLLALQKSGISPDDYAAELDRLVREGKISPATAAKLLAQYRAQRQREQAKNGAYAVQQMAKNGEITADVANQLLDLQKKGVSVDDYAAALNRLVAEGKMTPAAAAKLLALYKQQHLGGCPVQLMAPLDSQLSGAADDLVSKGSLKREEANALIQMIQKGDCAGANNFLVSKKIPPPDMQKFAVLCPKYSAMQAEQARFDALQNRNASMADYTEELKRAVQAGLVTPETASGIMSQCRAIQTPAPTGVAPTVETNIPGAADFAKLQQITPAAPAAPPPEEFKVAQTEVRTETDQERQQRIDALQAAMQGQATQLVNAWQPPVMAHREGAGGGEKGKGEGAGAGAGGTTTETKTTETKLLTRPLIKAGTILFAVLDTAVNSDYPDTPVMATIVQGPLKGARVLGKLSLAQGMDRVSLNFNLMDKDDWITTKSINAFAIDPDTARTVMASSVDYHYFKRYGAMMASAFISGYANAITTAGSTATTGIFGTSTAYPQLSPASKLAVGLGQVGTTMGKAVANYINTPTTVVVNSGVGIGILFMSEVPE